MDVGMPRLNGIEATQEILRHSPDVRIIMLTMYDDEHTIRESVRAGARGFVLKTDSDIELIDALRTVAKGGAYFSSAAYDRIFRRMPR